METLVADNSDWFSDQELFQKNHKLIDHIKKNPRIIAQQGAFILFQGEHLSSFPRYRYETVRIDKSAKAQLRNDLRLYFGIHTGSIYPEEFNLVHEMIRKSKNVSSGSFSLENELKLIFHNIEKLSEYYLDELEVASKDEYQQIIKTAEAELFDYHLRLKSFLDHLECHSNVNKDYKDVYFSYNEEPVLTGVSFVAKQGEITALVGPSGSGKSTVSKLAARFWDADSGLITLGGIDVKTVEPEVLLKNYAIVFQNVTLFDESVMENIRLGRSGASDEDVRAAAKAAQCDEFIDRLPQGYDTNIGENGSKLSGGERQRISIARALLKNAPVILLDEATASMDAESETMVQTALSALLKGRTVIVIAHRMRTIANADKIVVLDKGKVTEVGTPSELAKKGGLYAHLVALQQKQQMSSLPT